jgi:hypothetical protein
LVLNLQPILTIILDKYMRGKNPYILKTLAWVCVLYFVGTGISAQPLQRVTHLTGTQKINDIQVTVQSKGMVPRLGKATHCNGDTGPYYLGYNTVDYSCATGSYTFTFTPPVAFVNMNFSGASTSSQYNEEIMIEVNGHPYPIAAVGTPNSCESLAVLTPRGTITGCEGCSGSGWNGTRIEGPIYTLTVIDSVLMGEPAGILFGLYMSYISLEEDLGSRVCAYKKESASGSALIIEGTDVDVKLLSVAGPTGEKDTYYAYCPHPNISVDITGFTKGADYTFELLVNDQLITKKITIW